MRVLKNLLPILVLFSISSDHLQAQEGNTTYDFSYASIEKFCSFLNASPASDTFQLYTSEMEGGPIIRLGTPGFYTYSYIEKNGSLPMRDLSWSAASLFCKWEKSGALSQALWLESMEHGLNELRENNLALVHRDASHVLISEENVSQLKNSILGNDKMHFWIFPKTGESFLKPLHAFNGSIEKEYCDPKLQSNLIGCALSDFVCETAGAISFSNDQEEWFGVIALLSLVSFGGVYYLGGSIHCNHRTDPFNPMLRKNESTPDASGASSLSNAHSHEYFEKVSLVESIMNSDSIAQEDLFVNHPYSLFQDIESLQNTFEKMHETFLLHVALDHKGGATIAASNALRLNARASEIDQRTFQGEDERKLARASDHSLIDQKLFVLQKLAESARRGAETYKTIALIEQQMPEHWNDLQNKLLNNSIRIEAAQAGLKYAFQDLSPLHLQAIRGIFDSTFKNSLESADVLNRTLVLKDYQFFIEQEREKSRNAWTRFYYQRNPLLNAFAWRTFASFITALKSQVFFTDHVSAATSIAMNYAVMTVGDYTSCYRQFPLEQEELSLADSNALASKSTYSSMMYEFYTRVCSGEYFSSPVFYSMVWNFYRTVFSVTRNYPGNFFHDHFSAFIGAAWVNECVDDLTRGWRQYEEGPEERNILLREARLHEEDNNERSFQSKLEDNSWHVQPLKNELLLHAREEESFFQTNLHNTCRSSWESQSLLFSNCNSDVVTIDALFSQLDKNELLNSNKRILGDESALSFQDGHASINDLERLFYSQGTHLVRAGIYKKFGIGAIQRFDNQFQIKIRAQNPLMGSELQTFFISEKEKFKESYFISPISRWSEQEGISEEVAHYIIKSSGRKSGFNPFYHTEFLDPIDDEDETLEGISEARDQLCHIFNDLKPFHQRDIISNFNIRFTPSGNTCSSFFADSSWKEEPLTVQAFQSFILEQREKSQQRWTQIYYDCISNPYLCAGLWNTATVASAAVRIYFFSHNLAVSTLIVMAVNIPGDLTGRYRQLPREQE
jgi:hypothetical protein